MSIELESAGAEYLYWTVGSVTPLNCNVYVAFLTDGVQPGVNTRWSAATWVDGVSTLRSLKFLVAGPVCTPVPGGAVQLPTGCWTSWIKLARDPEVVIRQGSESLIIK